MRRLFEAGWKGVPLREWNGSEKEFVIAFDDGYQCVGDHAVEILAEFGFRASVFFPTGYLGKTNDWDHQVYGLKFKHLDRTGLKRLVDAGWELGSHTVSHLSLLDIAYERVERELVNSKAVLEDTSGQSVVSISFPFGRYNQSILDQAIAAGYKLGIAPRLIENVTTDDRFKVYEADAVYMWDRFANLQGRLLRTGAVYRFGRYFRKIVNRASAGTVIYQRLASTGSKNLP